MERGEPHSAENNQDTNDYDDMMIIFAAILWSVVHKVQLFNCHHDSDERMKMTTVLF